jgi:hypothetical protein
MGEKGVAIFLSGLSTPEKPMLSRFRKSAHLLQRETGPHPLNVKYKLARNQACENKYRYGILEVIAILVPCEKLDYGPPSV